MKPKILVTSQLPDGTIPSVTLMIVCSQARNFCPCIRQQIEVQYRGIDR